MRDNLVELVDTILKSLNDACFELSKVILDGDHVIAVVVLLDDLLVETVVDLSLQDVRIILSLHRVGTRVVGRGMLSKQLNVLLCGVASLVDVLGAFACSLLELLRFVLDLGVQSFEDRKYRSLQGFASLGAAVRDALRVGADVVEKTSNTPQVLVEMMALLEWTAHSLQDLVVILGIVRVDLLGGPDVILEVRTSVLVGLQTLVEELGNFAAVFVGHGIIVGPTPSREVRRRGW